MSKKKQAEIDHDALVALVEYVVMTSLRNKDLQRALLAYLEANR